jgi:hypothetical protein
MDISLIIAGRAFILDGGKDREGEKYEKENGVFYGNAGPVAGIRRVTGRVCQ